jgi:cytochrome c oxidase subunit 3
VTDHALNHDDHHHEAHGAHGDDHHGEHHHEEASIFPPIVGIGTAMLLFGIATNWNKLPWGMAFIALGLTVQLVGMVGWWWELVEANKSDATTLIGTVDEVQKILKSGFAFFIGSEIMFFAAFFAFYFYTRFHSPVWPPPGYESLPIPPALINTALLVTSGFIYMLGEHWLVQGKPRGQVAGTMALAVLLGLIFLGVQGSEWATLMGEGFHATDGTFGSAFYGLTGFHGFHVIVGALFLAVIAYRVAVGHFTAHKHFAMTAAGWYWHFVDVVWIGLVAVLYLWAH